MKNAQQKAQDMVRVGAVDAAGEARYIRAVRTYFNDFAKEARAHLRDIDRRLEHVNQVHFNLSAERGVAVKRIEATQSVLHDVLALGDTTP